MNEINNEEEAERKHFISVLTTFQHYKSTILQRICKTEEYMSTLPAAHRRRLQKYQAHLVKAKECVHQNDTILNAIRLDAADIFENSPIDTSSANTNCLMLDDVEKLQSVLKLLVRDWSLEGAAEREQCYRPIIDEICKQFPSADGISVLVPGAGLGRLAFEIAMRGFRCQGNEFSLFMLFSSNYVLNRCHQVNGYKVYPWLHQFVNNLSCEHQLKEVTFPDVDPSALVRSDFSMIAGDFLTVYTAPDEWDCLATCFFIDCASNIIEFVETIFNILKPGGVWVNLGPLLYHYSDMPSMKSIEPPFDVLQEIIVDVGFIIEKIKTGVKTKYSQNPKSMLQYEYDSIFFVCRKPK